MYSTPTLATRFARNTRVLRGNAPLSEDQMRSAARSTRVLRAKRVASVGVEYMSIPSINGV